MEINPTFTAKVEIDINAPASKVWEALITPALIKKYLMGTDVKSDWQVGDPITYSGEWKGKSYQDKGVILAVEPEKMLSSTYWSSMSGQPDLPENYNTVTYHLEGHGDHTHVTLIQDNNKTQEGADHSKKNWEMVLGKLKEILE